MLEEHLQSVADLATFLKKRPNYQQITSWISEKALNHSAVFYYEMDSDGWIRTIASAGFEETSLANLPTIHITDEVPAALLLRRMKIIAFSEKELENLNLAISKLKRNLTFRSAEFKKWKSAIGIPIGSNKGYTILFQIDITQVDGFLTGLEILRSLLETYDEFANEGKSIKPILVSPLKDTPLTERQNQIVKLIENGKTNSQIKLVLGFSESLIRQETIEIYQKLGISGRKALIVKDS